MSHVLICTIYGIYDKSGFKVVFHSRMNFFPFSWTQIVLLHYIDHQVTMLWTSKSENCGTSLKKDISKRQRPTKACTLYETKLNTTYNDDAMS